MSGYGTVQNANSAFEGYLGQNGRFFYGYTFPSKRYYDKYSYGRSETEYTRGKLGDATKEMAPTGTTGNWYSDYADFVKLYYPWFKRGGYCLSGANAGAFHFQSDNGNASIYYSARAVISNLN